MKQSDKPNKKLEQNIHKGHRERVKQEFRKNRLENADDYRLLEMLLFYAIPHGDVNPLAHRLISSFGSLAGVLEATEEDLCRVDGVGSHTALMLQLVLEMGRRYALSKGSMKNILYHSGDYYEVLRGYFYGARNEMIYMLSMDAKGKQLAVAKLSEGTFHAAEIITRKVVEAAMAVNAVKVVLAHNHVSEIALPSAEDKLVTLHIRDVLELLGITLVDHLIIVHDDYVSLSESGIFH